MSPHAEQMMGPRYSITNKFTMEERVVWFCLAMALMLGGIQVGHYASKVPQKCELSLPDGRRLQAFHLGVNGQEKCVYEQSRVNKQGYVK